MTIDAKDYQPLFRYEGKVSRFASECFAKGSHALCDPIIIFADDTWSTFLKTSTLPRCLARGEELFGKEYDAFAKEFRMYLEGVKREIDAKYGKPKARMTVEEFRALTARLARFWEFYGYTEWFYTERAYERSKSDPLFKQHVEDFENLKFESRDVLNLITHRPGIIDSVLLTIEKATGRDEAELRTLTPKELEQALAGKRPKARPDGWGLVVTDGKVTRLTGKRARALLEKLSHKGKTDELTGRSATPGTATGRAFVMPMALDKRLIARMAGEMRDGDILIAQSTSPEITHLCEKAKAIVTDQGGMLSHAAIISRERKIPCIVGTNHATRVFKTGDMVEVDADAGVIRKVRG